MQDETSRHDFDALVRAHHATVYRCAWRVLRSEADARDLAQEVFLELLEHPERFREARDARAVLAWSATKKALAQLRGERNRRRREDDHAMPDSTQQTPRDHHEAAEVRGVLARLVDALPSELRVALGLRYEEDLTFAAIAEATGCSEPTAHDRVQRALEKLRGDLRRAGLAGAVPALPGILSKGAAPIPSGLETQLLSLTKVAGGSVHWMLYGGVLIATLGTVVAVRAILAEDASADASLVEPTPIVASHEAGASSRSEALQVGYTSEEGREVALGDREAIEIAETGDAEVATSGDARADIPLQTLTGRVLTQEGEPIAGVWVRAMSREHQGKVALFHDSDHSSRDGRFTLELPVSREGGQAYRLLTTHPDYVSTRREHVLVTLDEEPAQQELRLLPNTADAPGAWSLALSLTDPEALPVKEAKVRVFRRVLRAAEEWQWVVEEQGWTDANGRVRIDGGHLGEKRIEIDPKGQGLQTRTLTYGVDRIGAHELHETLSPGLVVEGTVTTVDGSPLPDDLRIVITGEDTNEWRFAEVGQGGNFRYDGLDPGVFTLRTSPDGWSPVFLRDLEAGCGPLFLALKRRTDTRDVGTHMAELHGTLRDAVTGEAVSADLLDVESIPLWDDAERDLPVEELYAIHRTQRPYQIMMNGEWPAPTPDWHEVGLVPRRYLIAARVPGYAPRLAGPFDLAEGELRAGIDLDLERGGTLVGRVTDAEGRAIPKAYLYLAPDSDYGRRRLLELDHLFLDEGARALFECERANDDGSFRVEHLPTGQPYLLCALSRDHAPTIVGRVRWSKSGETLDRAIEMPAR